MYSLTVGILQSKQQELIGLMQDKTKNSTQKLSYSMMYDDISESIKVLNREFFKIEQN